MIEVGVDLVGREGSQALSLREIARRAGVSHGAPRRYFPTHHALLAAIAREGYEHLGQLVAETVGGDEVDSHARLLALGRLYLDFARTNRGMFELMFRHELLQGNRIGSVALGVSKIEGDLIGEVCSHPCVVAAGVCVCWVPVPAGRHRAGRAVVSALQPLLP